MNRRLLALWTLYALAGCERIVAGLDLERMIDQEKVEAFEASDLFGDGRGMRPLPPDTVPHGRAVLSSAALGVCRANRSRTPSGTSMGRRRIGRSDPVCVVAPPPNINGYASYPFGYFQGSSARLATGAASTAGLGPGFPDTLLEGGQHGGHVTQIPVPVDRLTVERGKDRFEIFCAACHGLLGDGDSLVARRMSLRRPRSLIEPAARNMAPGHIFHVMTVGYGLMPSYAAELGVLDRWAVVAYVRALQVSQATLLDDLPEGLRRQAEEALP